MVVFVALIDPSSSVDGCSPAPRRGDWVDIRDESALIIWDAERKTEHFIRRASFETAASDFGFLVPTPTKPDLGEVDDWLFESLGQTTAARHIHETKTKTVFGFGPLLSLDDFDRSEAMPGAAVEVLDQQQVAGLDATVLRADDAQALAEWLDQHGYEARPALTEWLSWYVDHGWVITAFKLTKGERPKFEAKSVRMTFQTDKPFYPYREPEDMRNPKGQGARTLRVFFLSDQRYAGTLGDAGKWQATTPYANENSFGANVIGGLAGIDAAKSLQSANYLTEFEDRSFPRPGTDEVYFAPASDQSATERPPVTHTTTVIKYVPGPWGTFALIVAVPLTLGAVITRRLRRRSAA